ncbi:MAG: DUF1543 domain-containing protein [Chitinophagaceae bacterium]
MNNCKLFMILVGCKPNGRHTEQHDVFFGIGESVKELLPAVIAFWPEAKGKLHIDGYREVYKVGEHCITIAERSSVQQEQQLFFINLGGYKENEFEEFHYKMLATGKDKNEALRKAKATAFFKHTGFESATAHSATSHIDDKYGVDVDDLALIEEILPADMKERFTICIMPAVPGTPEDLIHLGYFKLTDF